ncbi:MAG: metal-sulfur cluster assembly factor [Lysinibacillus sp.]
MTAMTKEQVFEELACVIDPELGVDIVNLGLVYDVEFVEEHQVKVKMTMTSMGCPMAGHIVAEVKETLFMQMPELKVVDVDIVWTPAWSKDRMSRLAKMALGLRG